MLGVLPTRGWMAGQVCSEAKVCVYLTSVWELEAAFKVGRGVSSFMDPLGTRQRQGAPGA